MENGSKLKHELKSIEGLFKDGQRIFQVPDYQRGYSWEKQQQEFR